MNLSANWPGSLLVSLSGVNAGPPQTVPSKCTHALPCSGQGSWDGPMMRQTAAHVRHPSIRAYCWGLMQRVKMNGPPLDVLDLWRQKLQKTIWQRALCRAQLKSFFTSWLEYCFLWHTSLSQFTLPCLHMLQKRILFHLHINWYSMSIECCEKVKSRSMHEKTDFFFNPKKFLWSEAKILKG